MSLHIFGLTLVSDLSNKPFPQMSYIDHSLLCVNYLLCQSFIAIAELATYFAGQNENFGPPLFKIIKNFKTEISKQ